MGEGTFMVIDEEETPDGRVVIYCKSGRDFPSAWLYRFEANGTRAMGLDVGDARARILKARLERKAPPNG